MRDTSRKEAYVTAATFVVAIICVVLLVDLFLK